MRNILIQQYHFAIIWALKQSQKIGQKKDGGQWMRKHSVPLKWNLSTMLYAIPWDKRA